MTKDRAADPEAPIPADAEEGRPLAETLARAEAAVTELTANYAAMALEDLAKCRAALEAARTEPTERDEHLKRLHGIAHNIKGQGTSFGYPLVTRIGQSLCQMIRGNPNPRDAELTIVQAHLDALNLVLERRIKGDGGEAGRKLAERLEALAGGAAG